VSERAGAFSRSSQPALIEAFQKAIFCHQHGRLSEAERYYQVALKTDDRHFPSVHGLGLTWLQQGRHADAVPIFRRAIKISSNSAEAHHHLAVALIGLGRLDEAVQGFEKALALNPNFAEAHDSLGHALQTLGRAEEALTHHQRALAIKPAYATAHNNLGNALSKLGRLDESVVQYEKALALRSVYPEAHNNLGLVLARLGRDEAAIAQFEMAVASGPNYVHAHVNLGNALAALRRDEAAIPHYQKALALDPSHVDAHICLGQILFRLDRSEEALAHCEKALAIKPATHAALSNVGALLWKLNRRDEALAGYNRALAMRPDAVPVLVNRANALAQLRRFDEALADYARALKIRPDYAGAHYGEALVRLYLGDFQLGLEKYEWREKDSRCFGKPLWRGDEDIRGKTILVHAEQGLGDSLQCCRYMEFLAERGARVVLEIQPALQSLLASLAGVDAIIAVGEAWPDFDCHCSIMSLPLIFKTKLETIPAKTPYIKASPELVAKWEQRLGAKKRPRIGLVWSGNPNQADDHIRSMPLRNLLPLFSADVQLISLQKEVRRRDREFLKSRDDLVHFGEELRDFSDTAAIVDSLDLVISTCTSVGHLAGALNKPTWFLLSAAADWRWLLHRDDSPWYPSARLFRQPKLGDWASVIRDVAAELHRFGK
jgi:tetratricopeptide (TPR) repeat protein